MAGLLKQAGSLKSSDTRLRPSQNQRMHVMRPLVGVHHLEVHEVLRIGVFFIAFGTAGRRLMDSVLSRFPEKARSA